MRRNHFKRHIEKNIQFQYGLTYLDVIIARVSSKSHVKYDRITEYLCVPLPKVKISFSYSRQKTKEITIKSYL